MHLYLPMEKVGKMYPPILVAFGKIDEQISTYLIFFVIHL